MHQQPRTTVDGKEGMQAKQSFGSPEDHLEIQDLVNRFENAFDQGDLDAHMATWGEEITFRSAFGDFDDRASYREWASAFMVQTRAQGGTRHLITNTEIEVDGDRAVHRCYLTIIMRRERQFYTSAFTDALLRTEKRWRFRERRLESDQALE